MTREELYRHIGLLRAGQDVASLEKLARELAAKVYAEQNKGDEDWFKAKKERDEARAMVQRWHDAWFFDDIKQLDSVSDDTAELEWIEKRSRT